MLDFLISNNLAVDSVNESSMLGQIGKDCSTSMTVINFYLMREASIVDGTGGENDYEFEKIILNLKEKNINVMCRDNQGYTILDAIKAYDEIDVSNSIFTVAGMSNEEIMAHRLSILVENFPEYISEIAHGLASIYKPDELVELLEEETFINNGQIYECIVDEIASAIDSSEKLIEVAGTFAEIFLGADVE